MVSQGVAEQLRSDVESEAILQARPLRNYPRSREVALLLLIAFAAILVHGYHPGVEDAEIYLPGIKKTLNPSLYPQNAAFFMSHAHMTLFPKLIAASVRLTHLPLDWAMFLWQWCTIFLLLLACWHVGRLAWRGRSGPRWGGVALVAALLTIPVSGTALYIMDEYVTTRSFSTPAVLFIIVNAAERKYVRALLWTGFTALIHPLMAVFGIAFAAVFLWADRESSPWLHTTAAAALLPFGLFPPLTDAYREVLNSRPYFFLLRWHWYEWMGIFAPLALLWCFRSLARSRGLRTLERMCSALVVFQLIFFGAALAITIAPSTLARFAELQPMRSLHLVYILFFTLAGGFLATSLLRNRIWRWLALFVPLCAGMWFAQQQLFPATPHVEWPGTKPQNPWVEAFVWIRTTTPVNAYFALDPYYMSLPGEDEHGFRAIAERSRLADRVKDSGAVTMFPALAETWREQVQAEQGWEQFKAADFLRLRKQFGVDWVVVKTLGVTGLQCPYRNSAIAVCHVASQ